MIYSGLKTAIGANVTGYSNKVYPLIAPEGTALPYATYQQLFTERIKTHDGYNKEGSMNYQFNFYSSTFIASKTAASQFIEYFKNFRGALGTDNIQDVEVLNEFDDMDYVGSVARYRTIVEIKFHYNEP